MLPTIFYYLSIFLKHIYKNTCFQKKKKKSTNSINPKFSKIVKLKEVSNISIGKIYSYSKNKIVDNTICNKVYIESDNFYKENYNPIEKYKYPKYSSCMINNHLFAKKYNELINTIKLEFNDEFLCYQDNCCPNCGTIQKELISKTKKCFSCKEKIYLKNIKEIDKKILLSENRKKELEEYLVKFKDFNFYANLLNKKYYLICNYIEPTLKMIKTDNTSLRDFCYTFFNQLALNIESTALKTYNNAKYKDFDYKVLNAYDIKCLFDISCSAYENLLLIDLYQEKYNSILSKLTFICTKKIENLELFYNLDTIARKNETDYINSIDAALIIFCLDADKLSVNDFKEYFFKHAKGQFIKIDTNFSWKYIEKAIDKYIN